MLLAGCDFPQQCIMNPQQPDSHDRLSSHSQQGITQQLCLNSRYMGYKCTDAGGLTLTAAVPENKGDNMAE